MIEKTELLSMRRLAGESVIEHPPLFYGEHLFITRKRTVRAYSSTTGELVVELEETNEDIVNIDNNPSKSLLYGCTVNGEIISWKYNSGTINSAIKINVPSLVEVQSFHIVPYNDYHFGLLTWKADARESFLIGLFDLTSGLQEDVRLNSNLPATLRFSNIKHKVAVSKNRFNTIAIIQNGKLPKLLVANYGNKKSQCWLSANQEKLKVVACHPEKEVVATGDKRGRIFIYHDIYSQEKLKTELVHWHHNPVGSIVFSASGSTLYSGGQERLLVAWNYSPEKTTHTHFLPRISGCIVHIVVNGNGSQIAVATDDNAITLYNPQFEVTSYIQNFVWATDDKTPWPKFPFGLKVDPRTSSIVLNGRVGQLQFYSTHTRSVSNFDTTIENRLSLETRNILYNTRITQTALNTDWLVIAESLDDLEHLPEVRLKFWKFETDKQAYVLNTHIESPHEGAVTALAFSSSFREDNLLCASSGLDRKIKVWSLQETTSIDKKGKYWVCLETTSYKNLAVKSLTFSPDGSLLAVGFGNVLCIYVPETLRMKFMLSTPAGQDGSANKLKVIIPTSSLKSKSPSTEKHRTEVVENRKQIQQLVKAYLEKTDNKLLTAILDQVKKNDLKQTDSTNGLSVSELSVEDKEMIFKSILSHNELNLHQKLEIFQKLGIRIRLPGVVRQKFNDYINVNMSVALKENDLLERSKNIDTNSRFIAFSKLQIYKQRRDEDIANGLHLKNVTFDDEVKGNKPKKISQDENIQPIDIDEPCRCRDVIFPIKKVSQINHVVFATRELSHFVIVCTEKRLLIWNLLTLRVHAALKISVKHITVDPYTSLVAVFTYFNELYVFLPSTLYTLYVRENLPNINGAVWIPRQYPKSQSIDVDWQAISQLFFFSEDQELLYLASDNDEDMLAVKTTTLNEDFQLHPKTPFGAMIAKQITSDAVPLTGQRTYYGALLGEPTRRSVESLTSLSCNSMGSVNQFCEGFLASLAATEIRRSKESQRKKDSLVEEDMDFGLDPESEDDDEIKEVIASRKSWLQQQAAITKPPKKSQAKINLELDKLMAEKLYFSNAELA